MTVVANPPDPQPTDQPEVSTLAKLLDAQTKRGDAMGIKFVERGKRIAQLEQEAARVQAEIAELRRWVRYNSTDLGEFGRYVRVDYVTNGIDAMVSRLAHPLLVSS